MALCCRYSVAKSHLSDSATPWTARQALRWVNTRGRVAREKQGLLGKPHTPQIRHDLQIPDLAFTIDPLQPEIHEHRNKRYVELPSAGALEAGCLCTG